MGTRFRSWWQQIKRYRVTILVGAIILVVAIALIIVEIRLYGTGFAGKTLFDWLTLLGILAVPALVGFGAVWFTARQNHDLQITRDNQREKILQSYLDTMSELLLHEDLSEAQHNDVVANIAETRTLIALLNLDSLRKGIVIIFLAASGLINRRGNIIDLSFAYLRGVNLRRTQKLDGISLEGANLIEADFSEAVLTNVNFQRADLRYANLSETDLSGADFNDADLSDANLIGAIVTIEQLKEAESLKGATMSDGSIHP